MIEFSRSYKASNGKCYSSLEEAQTVEIALLIASSNATLENLPAAIVANKEGIVNILTLTDASRPKARGVPKKRKPKADPQIKVA